MVRLDVNTGLDQTSGDIDIVHNFKNADWTGNEYALTAYGNSGDNTLIGAASGSII